MKDSLHFESKDFYLSAILIACGKTLIKLNKSQGDFVDFVFKESPEDCIETIESYWADELLINPKKLISAINELKTRLHQGI